MPPAGVGERTEYGRGRGRGRVSTLVFLGGLLLGVGVYGLTASRLDLGSVSHPGTGFFPLLVAVAAAVLTLVCMGQAWGEWRVRTARGAEEGAPPAAAGGLVRVMAFAAACGVYIPAMSQFGYVVPTALLGSGLLKLMGVGTGRALGIGALVSGCLWLVLGWWLRVPLPLGPWGF